jgi:N-acetyl-beta-hexosaminidase
LARLQNLRLLTELSPQVLHLHLSEGAYRLPTDALPALNRGVRHWSREDVRSIVAYATDRGVRVVPEVDLPGHAMGFAAVRQAPGRRAIQTPRSIFCMEHHECNRLSGV